MALLKEDLREAIISIHKRYYELVNNNKKKVPNEAKTIQKILSTLTGMNWKLVPENQLADFYEKIKSFEEKVKNIDLASEEATLAFANMDILPFVSTFAIFQHLTTIDETQKLNHEASSLIDQLKLEVTQQAINSHIEFFEEQSIEFTKASKIWLVTLIILLLCIIGFGFFIYFEGYVFKEPNVYNYVHNIVGRVVIITGLLYFISISSKNFKAQKHNSIINRHRANCLKTFESFNKSTSDQQTKDAILLEASHTIFGYQSTGYTDTEESDPTKIIEIIKNISPQNKY